MSDERDETRQDGIQFRAVDGRRSSQRAGKQILAHAVAAVAPDLAGRIETTKDWRKGYLQPVREVVVQGTNSTKNALRIAADGLHAVRQHFVFVRKGDELPLSDAVRDDDSSIQTAEIKGEGRHPEELVIPYRGHALRGDALLGQIDRWEAAGTLERSAAATLREVATDPGHLDLSGRRFVLLGAASEMGPLEALSAWGAHVIAVDLPRRHLWDHIIGVAVRGSGRLSAPVRDNARGEPNAANAGVDFLTETPAISAWLKRFEEPLTAGNYVYADGATFLRVAAAADALIEELTRNRTRSSIAYMATPTDVFAVPEDVVAAARSVAATEPPRRKVVRGASGARLFAPSYRELVRDEDGRNWGICDCLVPIQGANYAAAKAIQRWRAIAAREEGITTSANVAPASRTRSVVKNRMLAAAYRGAPAYGIEIFESVTSRWIMAALLVHDLHDGERKTSQLRHPYELFVQGAVHGGIWRFGYEPRSVLPLALLTGAIKKR